MQSVWKTCSSSGASTKTSDIYRCYYLVLRSLPVEDCEVSQRIQTCLQMMHIVRALQELIIQNFQPKKGTAMAGVAAPSLEELLWTIAVARILFGPAMNIQAPPNLTPGTPILVQGSSCG